MLTRAAVLLMLPIVSGCDGWRTTSDATLDRLREPMRAHATALSGDDVPLMRSTGRDVIAIYMAGHPR